MESQTSVVVKKRKSAEKAVREAPHAAVVFLLLRYQKVANDRRIPYWSHLSLERGGSSPL